MQTLPYCGETYRLSSDGTVERQNKVLRSRWEPVKPTKRNEKLLRDVKAALSK